MNSFQLIFVFAAVLIGLCTISESHAQLEINGFSIDGGGGISDGGNFNLHGIIGQPEADNVSSGGSFSVVGGFQRQSIAVGDLNGDGIINLLDVAPFVEAVTNGLFVAEADINGDGEVDLLDVNPFVQLLSGE